MDDMLLCVCSPPDVDIDLFTCWSEGKSAQEALMTYKGGGGINGGFVLEFDHSNGLTSLESSDMLKFHIADQYRLFDILEHYLRNPILLSDQTLCIIPPSLRTVLIDKYWDLDATLAREILNKKLSKNRNHLEDASEATGLKLRKVTRQFDNISRIFNVYDEDPEDYNLYSFIRTQYLLGHNQAVQYTNIVFLLYSKFNLTAKRRLQRASCDTLSYCVPLILAFLTLDSATFYQLVQNDLAQDALLLENDRHCWNLVWRLYPMVQPAEPDKQMLINLRDLRTAMTTELLDAGIKAVKNKLGAALVRRIDSGFSLGGSNSRLRTIIKSLFLLGANLSQSREYRDLFEDILTKLAEPMEEVGLSAPEMGAVLGACSLVVTSPHDSSSSGYGNGSIVKTNSSGSAAAAASGSGNSTSYNSSSSVGGVPPPVPTMMRTTTSDLAAGTSGGLGMGATKGGLTAYARNTQLKGDWDRFVTFCRLCLVQLVEGGSKRNRFMEGTVY